MTYKITTDFAGTESLATTKTRLESILDFWLGSGSTSSVSTWGDIRTLLNTVAPAAITIADGELASSFRTKLNTLNSTDGVVSNLLFNADEPGVWYDPSQAANLDWRRNLLLYTEQFDNAAWTKDGTSVSALGSGAFSLTENTATGNHRVFNASGVNMPNSTRTIEVKANGRDRVALRDNNLTGPSFLLTGAGSVTAGTGVITSLADGWYRITASTATASASERLVLNMLDASGSASYTGDGASGIFIRFPQLEVGSTATEYQPITDLNTEVLELFPDATLFQDTAGTTPVTTPGQTVGLMLDKSGNGFHATQATAAARPTYGIVPETGRRNLLTFTSWADAVGGSAGTAPTGWNIGFGADAQTSLVGGLDEKGAQSIRFDADAGERIFYGQTVSLTAGITYSLSAEVVDVSGGAATAITLLGGTATGTLTSVGSPSVPGRYTARFVCTGSGTKEVRFGLGCTGAIGETSHITFKQPQLETGSTATAYQKVTTQFDVTEAGVPSLGYLSFDGVDDFMVTPTITPGTDKVQVFAGVRKLSDAAVGILFESSTSIGTNNGVIGVAAPLNTSGSTFAFASKGTALTAWSVSGAPFAAPSTVVLTGVGDIAADAQILRLNGAQVQSLSNDQGTGNYLAYPLYIGRRAGTANPFNGHIYSLITRFGPNLSSDVIGRAETYTAQKTGVAL